MWPVLEYKNFETKKLQQAFEDEGTYKENVPVFDGEGGKTGNTEAFLYVQERFNSVSSRKFEWDELEKFDNFEDVHFGHFLEHILRVVPSFSCEVWDTLLRLVWITLIILRRVSTSSASTATASSASSSKVSTTASSSIYLINTPAVTMRAVSP